MADTPTRQRADEEVIVAWIRDLNDKAVELTDHKPQVFEVRNLFFTSYTRLTAIVVRTDRSTGHRAYRRREHLFPHLPISGDKPAQAWYLGCPLDE